MTTSVQRRRGSTVQHSTFTGLEGEITIDTTKDTAVVHDGSTVGGFPLAKENLANANTTALTAIIGTDTASDDTFLIYDTSAGVMKKITRAELNNAIEVDALANVTITGGSINGTTVGASTASTGAFTTLTSSSTTTLNGTTIPASKTLLVSTDIGSTVQAYDADLTAFAAKTAPSGEVVGTTDTQTLTNKTIDGAINTLTNLPLANITEPVRHSVRPSLLLDFANTKTLDPRITFTRASTGTYYDGKTTVKAEENLFTYSEQFNNAIWATGASISANTSVAPDGNTTADTYTRTSTGEQRLRYTTTQANSTAYTVSVYAKAGTANFLRLRNVATFTTGTTDTAWFNLSTGAVATVGANVTATITSVGNSWYRCSITGTTVASIGASNLVDIASATSDAEVSSGTSGETIYLWGAQLEQRSSVTAYTATTTAPITNYIPALQTAASGVARFEHNPTTGESLGLEIEEQRTNLVTYSDDLSNAAWTKSNATITANTIIAPDGTLTGDKIVENTTSSIHSVAAAPTVVSGTTYTFSIYLKAAERGYAFMVLSTTFPGTAISINLSTGVASTTGTGTPLNIASTSVGNGWWRVSFSLAATSSAAAFVSIYTSTDGIYANRTYTGDGYSGIYIWGAQLEAGSFATSYIPTVASQVTRSADAASMTGTNFSSWYNEAEGTIYSSMSPAAFVANEFIWAIGTSTTRNIATYINATQIAFGVGGVILHNSTKFKHAGSWTTSNLTASSVLNGGTATSPSIVSGVNDTLFIGKGNSTVPGSFGMLNGTISKFAYYPKRLTNAELQGLTTV